MDTVESEKRGFPILVFLVVLITLGLVGVFGWRFWSRSTNPRAVSRTTEIRETSAIPLIKPTESKKSLARTDLGDISAKLNLQSILLTGAGTQGLAVDGETGLVYAGNTGNTISKCDPGDVQERPGRNTMSVIDPAKGIELARVPTDDGPIWPIVDPNRDVVYMANSGGKGTISIHEKGTGIKLESIQLGGMPHAAGVLDNILVVSNTNDKSQTYYAAINLETRKLIAHHPSPKFPHPVVVDAEEKLAYMMGVEAAEVVVIDMTTGQPKETFTLEGGAGQLLLSKKYGKILTDSSQPGTAVAIFDLKTKKQLSAFGFSSLNAPGTGLALDEDSGLAFVVVADKNAIGLFDIEAMQPVGYFTVGTCPYGIRLDPERGKGYVTNSGDNTLTVFAIKEVVAAISK